MPVLKRLSDWLNLIVTALCAALLVNMLGISFSGAIYQAVTGDALAWTYSLARQFLPWVALLSITVAFKNGEHVAMAMIVNALPSRIRVAIEWMIVTFIGLFALLLTIAGLQFTLEIQPTGDDLRQDPDISKLGCRQCSDHGCHSLGAFINRARPC